MVPWTFRLLSAAVTIVVSMAWMQDKAEYVASTYSTPLRNVEFIQTVPQPLQPSKNALDNRVT